MCVVSAHRSVLDRGRGREHIVELDHRRKLHINNYPNNIWNSILRKTFYVHSQLNQILGNLFPRESNWWNIRFVEWASVPRIQTCRKSILDRKKYMVVSMHDECIGSWHQLFIAKAILDIVITAISSGS